MIRVSAAYKRVAFTSTAQVRSGDLLGGLIHEYDLAE